jgi:PTS system nitrogen regulatory IIA component
VTCAMKIKDLLSASDVALEISANDKTSLLKELATRAASALQLPAEGLGGEIAKRDELGSTGIGGGVSIPHARLR